MLPLSPDQKEIFRSSGILRLERYIDEPYCNSLVDRLWDRLETHGIERNDRNTWAFEGNPSHHIKKLKNPIKQIDKRGVRNLYTDDLRDKASSLLTSEISDQSKHIWLITFPKLPSDESPWSVPRKLWHTDCPRLANAETPGIIVLSYLNDVDRSGGGTMVIAGSHKLYTTPDRRLASRNFRNKLKRHEFFRTLFSKTSDRPPDLRGVSDRVNGVNVEVVELTGKKGDVVLLDARILHSIATNVCTQPRIMLRGFFGTKELYQSYTKDARAA